MSEHLRYTPGHTYLFVRVKYEPNPGINYAPVYTPWDCRNVTIELVKLKCLEHHRVPDSYTQDQHDGFIFVDEHNQRWHNQYPRASYGQLDDSMDWKVRREEMTEEDNLWTRNWSDLPSWLLNIKRGEEKGEFSSTQVALLEAHRHDIENLVESQFQRKVIYGTRTVKSTYGIHTFQFPQVTFDPPFNAVESAPVAMEDKTASETCDHIACVSISPTQCQCMDCLMIQDKEPGFKSNFPNQDRG